MASGSKERPGHSGRSKQSPAQHPPASPPPHLPAAPARARRRWRRRGSTAACRRGRLRRGPARRSAGRLAGGGRRKRRLRSPTLALLRAVWGRMRRLRRVGMEKESESTTTVHPGKGGTAPSLMSARSCAPPPGGSTSDQTGHAAHSAHAAQHTYSTTQHGAAQHAEHGAAQCETARRNTVQRSAAQRSAPCVTRTMRPGRKKCRQCCGWVTATASTA